MTNGSTPAGWYQDPTGQGDARYWNGVSWTQSVDRAGTTVNIAIDPTQAQQPPVPGTQVQTPSPAPQTVVEQSSKSSPVGAIIGAILVILLIVVIFVIVSNDDSSDDSPTPGTDEAPAVTDEAPAVTDDAPATQPAATDPPSDGG